MRVDGQKILRVMWVCFCLGLVAGCGKGEKKADQRLTPSEPGVSGVTGEQRGSSGSGKEGEGIAGGATTVTPGEVAAPPEPEADEPPPQTSTRDAQNADVVIGQRGIQEQLAWQQGFLQAPPDWVSMAEQHVRDWAAYFAQVHGQQQNDSTVQALLEPEKLLVLGNPDQEDPWYVDSILDTERVTPASGQKVSGIRYFHEMFGCDQGGERRAVGYYMNFSAVTKVDATNWVVQYHPFIHYPCAEGEKNRALAKGLLVLNTAITSAQLQTAFNGILLQHLSAPAVRIRMVAGREKVERRQVQFNNAIVNVAVRVPDVGGTGPYNLLMLMIEGPQLGAVDLGKILLKRNIEPAVF